jgi:hypothetical protein
MQRRITEAIAAATKVLRAHDLCALSTVNSTRSARAHRRVAHATASLAA